MEVNFNKGFLDYIWESEERIVELECLKFMGMGFNRLFLDFLLKKKRKKKN